MDMSDDISALAEALSKAQGEILDASKGAENPYFKSKYADLASVRSVIREPMAKNGLSLVQLPKTVDGGVSVETLLLHSSGQFIKSSLFMPAAKADAHGIGSAITYARRYSIMSILCLATEDDDGNAAVDSVKRIAPTAKAVGGTRTIEEGSVFADALETAKLRAEANEVAKTGSEAMRTWWSGLKADKRSLLSSDDLKALKAAAAAADKGAE